MFLRFTKQIRVTNYQYELKTDGMHLSVQKVDEHQ